jgi:type IV secretory pathway VirD2 relaxase
MARSRFIAHDDDLHIDVGGRHDGATRPIPRRPRTTSGGPKAIVKVGLIPAVRVSRYATYMERDGVSAPGEGVEFFTRPGERVDRQAFIARSRGDPRAWTLIVSPGVNGLDMTRLVREFMCQLELDLKGRPGTDPHRLDWIAAIHYNTAHNHAHILLRGRDQAGREFRMSREHFCYGMAQRATEITALAKRLGWVREAPMHQCQAALGASIARLQDRLKALVAGRTLEAHGRS